MTLPLVSVILPVHNGQYYLADAIESVLTQSYKNFEFIIINDGSSDGSESIVRAINDSRIRYFYQPNQGLSATLNKGISLARGKYIARQDQDDVCFPTRLQEQVDFLECHQSVGMVGAWAEIWVDRVKTSRFLRHPSDEASIKFGLLFNNLFVHSSVMIRKEVLSKVGGYSLELGRQPPEDFELWSRIMRCYRVANIPRVLMAYREVGGSMSRTGLNPFLPNLVKICSENIAWASGCSSDAAEVIGLAKLIHGDFKNMPKGTSLPKVLGALRRVELAFSTQEIKSQVGAEVRNFTWKIRYQYANYLSGGLIGKVASSTVGNFVKNKLKDLF